MYFYTKALHIIFVVTWFAGLFYIVRLFIYNREAQDKPEPEKSILSNQFSIMIKRLWFGITWPSAVLTLILGLSIWYQLGYLPDWLKVKLCFVVGLFAYHFSLHAIYKQQAAGNFKYFSQQLRIWNEVATIFLLAIVMLAVVKREINWWGIVIGLVAVMALLMTAIKLYKRVRMKKENTSESLKNFSTSEKQFSKNIKNSDSSSHTTEESHMQFHFSLKRRKDSKK